VAPWLLAAGLLLAACGTQSLSSAMSAWSTGSDLKGALGQLTTDSRQVLAALDQSHASAAQLHTVCAVLDVETLQANASLPTPDDQTTNLLSRAYTLLGDAANVCYHAAGSAAKMTRVRSYLSQAGAVMSEAWLRSQALTSP